MSESADAARRPRFATALGLAIGACAFLAFLLFIGLRVGLNAPTRAAGDELDYDSLAWEISQGRGFGVDYLDPGLRCSYDDAAAANPIFQITSDRRGLITYRPPLFPYAIAATNALFGRQFWAMRIWNSAAMAICCGLAAATAYRCAGIRAAAVVAMLYIVVDQRTRLYAQAFLTEAFAVAELAALCVLLSSRQTDRLGRTLLIGLLFGIMILTRPMFLLWTPWIGLLLCRDVSGSHVRRELRGMAHGAAFALVLIATLLPWGIRNCRILGQIMPFGTQAAIELSSAWSEGTWQRWGEWGSKAVNFAEPDPAASNAIIERELREADASVRQAQAWLVANPGKAVALVPIKIVNEFLPNDGSQSLLLALAVLGAVRGRSVVGDTELYDRHRMVGVTFVAAQMLAVGLTWSVPESRFVVPLLFIEHLFAAIGIVVLVETVYQARVRRAEF